MVSMASLWSSTKAQQLRSRLATVWAWPWYPLAFASYPVLNFYSHNFSELLPQEIGLSLIGSVVGVALIFALCSSRLKLSQAAFLTLIVTFIFFSHGHLQSMIGPQGVVLSQITIGSNVFLVSVWLTLIAFTIYSLSRYPLAIRRAIPALNTVALVLLLTTAISLAFQLYHAGFSASPVTAEHLSPTDQVQPTNTAKPDIYYIILDRYAGQPALQDQYAFDNSPFLDHLQQAGFYVASQARTNYPKTSLSLASSLNFNYLQDLLPDLTSDMTESATVEPLIASSATVRTLKEYNYSFTNLGSWFEPTKTSPLADRNLVPDDSQLLSYDNFNSKFLDTTIWPFLMSKLGLSNRQLDWDENHRLWALFQFDKLKQIITQQHDQPQFVFAHILLPHDPLVFNAQCQPLTSSEKGRGEIPNYLDQLQCANLQVSLIVDQIKTHSPQSIIIIQADEGPSAMKTPLPASYAFEGASPDAIAERTYILNALYFPDHDYAQLYPTITPVNTFRTVFRQYFGYDLPNLPDTTYLWPDKDHLFDFFTSPSAP